MDDGWSALQVDSTWFPRGSFLMLRTGEDIREYFRPFAGKIDRCSPNVIETMEQVPRTALAFREVD